MKSPAPATFGRPRDFLDNRFVYLVISSRSRGLMIGLNLSPTRACSFQCVYCEVDRSVPGVRLEIPAMISELERTLMFVYSRQILEHSYYRNLDPDLLELRGVLLSGDGEPTLCPVFSEVVEAVDDLRCRGRYPFFKLILPTNTTGLSFAKNQAGLDRLTLRDEI